MPAKNERTVYQNGDFVPESRAGFGIYDKAVATGEKAVEVVRTFDHKPHRLDAHLNRLFLGLDGLGIDPGVSRQDLSSITADLLSRNTPLELPFVDWQLVYYISGGPAEHFGVIPEEDLKPTIIVQAIPLHKRLGKSAHKYTDGIDLVVVDQLAIPNNVLSPLIKSTGRMDHLHARRQANGIKKGATGILLDPNGFVTECTGASLFVIDRGAIVTSPTSRVLDGVTRKIIFDIADELNIPIDETDMTVGSISLSQELFITSTVICQQHARSLNNNPIGNGRIGEITSRVRDAFIEEVGMNFVQQALLYQSMLQK